MTDSLDIYMEETKRLYALQRAVAQNAPMTNYGAFCIETFINQLGGNERAASVLFVDVATVKRWKQYDSAPGPVKALWRTLREKEQTERKLAKMANWEKIGKAAIEREKDAWRRIKDMIEQAEWLEADKGYKLESIKKIGRLVG
jgi:hypothetical protein